MDTGPLVESLIDDGRYLLEKLAAAGFDVSAAAWVKTSGDEKWKLYVVSRVVDEQGTFAAYDATIKLLGRSDNYRLVGLNRSFGRRLVELQKSGNGSTPVRMELLRIGDVSALELYLYPPIAPVPPGQHPLTPREVTQKVIGLMERPAPPRPSRVTLRDGATFLGVPFGLEMSGARMHVKFAVDGLEPLRVYPVEAIQAIE